MLYSVICWIMLM